MRRIVTIALIIAIALNITACGDGSVGQGNAVPKSFTGTWYFSAVVLESIGVEKTVQSILDSEEEITIFADGTYQFKAEDSITQGKVEYNSSRETLKLYADPNAIGDWHDYEEDFEYPYSIMKMDGEHLLWYTDPDKTYQYTELSKSNEQVKKLDGGVYPSTNEQDLWDYFDPLKEDRMYYDTVVSQVASIPWYDSFIKRYKDHFRIWWEQNVSGGFNLSIKDAVGIRTIYSFSVADYGYPERTVEVYDVYDNYWNKDNYDEIASNEDSDSAPGEMSDNNEIPYNEEVIGYAEVIMDELYIRSTPSTQGNKPIRFAEQNKVYDVFDIYYDGQFTWYKVGDEEWFADNNGEWVVYTPNQSD